LRKKIQHVSIFGFGLMGGGIAQALATKGIPVRILRNPDNSDSFPSIRKSLEIMAEEGAFDPEEIENVLNRITVSSDLDYVANEADLIIECIPEDMTMKQNLFAQLDEICKPDTILASNTSVMSITQIASKAKNKHRIVGTHFWNPPYLIPLVEIVRTEFTDDEVVEALFEFFTDMGKKPVKVAKDVPGFLANRLQHALWREAISIVEHGIADAAAVDEAIKYSFGMRLPILSPMENADMVGTDLTLAIHNYLLKHLESSTEPSPLLVAKVAAGELGFKTGKGFQEWTPEDIAASRERLIKYLIKVTKDNR
jgi:3-hydroxybutyryl-CoA dehydrogenase